MDFSLHSYKKILQIALEQGYIFQPFDILEDHDRTIKSQLVCLLRHDIDVSVNAALAMAKLEYELGIQSTYFIMLRSPVYNLFSRENSEYLKKIIGFGHHIGLHYDDAYDSGMHQKGIDSIYHETEILQSSFDVEINTVSFHQPSPKILAGAVNTGRLVNTYVHPQENGFEYLSDSNRILKNSLYKVFKERTYERFQLLIHPIWWVYTQKSITDVWDNAITDSFIQMQRQFLETERAYGKKRKFMIINNE